MKKLIVALAALLSLGLASPALAGCELCVGGVTAHTRDGAEWVAGQPVTVVIAVGRSSAETAFPDKATGVVMELDRERVKCLDLRLAKISETGDSATYAGTFFPLRRGDYDGKVDLGGEPQDIAFVVGPSAGPAPTAAVDPRVPVTAPQPEPERQPPLVRWEAGLTALPYAAATLALALLAAFGGRRLVPARHATEQRLRVETESGRG